MPSSSLVLRLLRNQQKQKPSFFSLFFLSPTLHLYTELCSVRGQIQCANRRKRPSFIHPAAVVHPNAILGQGVSIGPFCSVGPSAKLGNACQLYPGSHVFGNTKMGDNCILMTGAVVGDEVPGGTVIGCNNVIGHHAVVGIKCQDLKYKESNASWRLVTTMISENIPLSIDLRSHVKEQLLATTILLWGLLISLMIAKWVITTFLQTIPLLAGHVVVGDYVHTAGAIVVHQFCCIGSYSFVGGGSVMSQGTQWWLERAELRGLNLEGLRRRGFSVTEMKSLRAAYRKIFMPTDGNSGGIENRLAEVEQHQDLAIVPAVCFMVQSIRESLKEDRRGICKFRSGSGS